MKGLQGADMDDSLVEVLRLLRLAQAGQAEQALVQAEEQLRADESVGILYARAVALRCLGDHEGAAGTAERMLALTIGRGETAGTAPIGTATAGWQSIALSFRACQHMRLAEMDPRSFDQESVLEDLVEAEAALSHDLTDRFVLASAHTGIGIGYHDLRLYELARPHYQAAFDVATTPSTELAVETAVKSQLNLAEMHLSWSVELYRIGDLPGAREQSAIAARHVVLAQENANTDRMQFYAAHAALLEVCADPTGGNDDQIAARIRSCLQAVETRSKRDSRAFALPFLARALDRAGRHSEAIDIATQACQALPEGASWLVASAAYHTRAVLFARSGSDSARTGLAYGDELAKTLWRQRLRTLHNARSVQILGRVTLERDRVHVLAHTDALTGVGNRRAFDVRVAELARSGAESAEVAMIVVDVDRLKAINDAGGHQAGDLTLQAVAGALSGEVRAQDLVARLGGDEFVAVLEGMSHPDAATLAARVVDAVSAALGSTVTVSVGVATGSAAEAGAGLLRSADRAMYAAKRANRVSLSEAEAPQLAQSLTG